MHNRLFAKRQHSSLGFVLAAALSLVFVVADAHYRSLDPMRSGLSVLVAPLQFAVDYPVRMMQWARTVLKTKETLVQDNKALRDQQTLLMARLQQFEIIRHENTQLKALLSVSSSAKMQSMVADILAVETSPARQLIVINKGSREGVVTGLPVLDSQGVMGQIIDVGRMTSTVLLISDSKSAVPVRNERTGELGILIGKNNRSRLSLIHLPRTALMAPGDLLVTSGLGRRYPKGYPVGKVDVVKNSPGDDFMNVSVRPVALLNRDRLVLVIWPKDDQVAWMTDLDERMRVMDDKV